MNETPTETIPDRTAWLAERRKGLGASDAAAAIGISRWKSNVTLWEEKTGRREPDDISDEEAVQRGIREEPGVRALFAAMHPEYLVYYRDFVLVRHPEEPWRLATLDGRLYDLATLDGRLYVPPDQMRGFLGPYGVLEIKTTEFRSRAAMDEWRGRVPTQYLAQVLHQMAVTGAEFAILFALIHCPDSATGRVAECREYRFDRADYAEQIEWLVARERDFWRHVESRTEPPLVLPEPEPRSSRHA